MRVLVLGGGGFIGSHIVDALLADGHSVRVFGHTSKARLPLPTVDYRLADFEDTGLLADALQDIDVVVHSISHSTPASSNQNPQDDIRSNLINTLGLLDLMCERCMTRLVFLSSGGTVYGNPETLPVSEEAPLHPISSYGIVKLAIENYLFMYERMYSLQPVIIRPSNPFGPRQGHTGLQGVVTSFLNDIMHERPLTVWGDGSIVRDFMDVRDLARLCSMAVSSPVSGIFNAGSGQGCSIREMIDLIASVTGKKSVCHFQPSRGFDVQKIVLDIRKSQTVFSWKPRISLEQGVREYWVWLQASNDSPHVNKGE